MSTITMPRADVAPPDGSFESTFLIVMSVVVAAPFLFGFLILTAAYVHRKRSRRPEKSDDHT
jgi:hypothetical protein